MYSVALATQSPLTVTTTAGTIGIDLTLATAGGSGSGAVTYVVANGTTTCTQPSPGVLHASGAGTCLVTATKAGDGNYTSRSSTATTVTFSENQTLVFTSTPPNNAFVNSTYTPVANSSANLTVTITIDGSSSSICSLSAGVVTFSAPGSCVIDANQAGQGNILPATQVQQTITVVPAVRHNAPSAPLDVAGAPGSGGVEVTWAPPSSSGSSAITDYEVTTSPEGASCESATTSCELVGLVGGTDYTISVVAINAVGDSPAGTATFSFSVAVTPTPGDVTVSSVGETVTVNWAAPLGSASGAVLGYDVTLEPGGQRCSTTTATTCTFSGVPEALEYSAEVTVVTAPGAPKGSATGHTSVHVFTIAHFAFDSYTLTPQDRRALSRFATMIARANVHALSLLGFTDDVGGTAFNAVLSRERAVAVGRYLLAQVGRRGYHGLSIREEGQGILRAGGSRARNRKVTAVL
jgi:outer membrane protein OmpA-like peptidoglycan-associated protein